MSFWRVFPLLAFVHGLSGLSPNCPQYHTIGDIDPSGPLQVSRQVPLGPAHYYYMAVLQASRSAVCVQRPPSVFSLEI